MIRTQEPDIQTIQGCTYIKPERVQPKRAAKPETPIDCDDSDSDSDYIPNYDDHEDNHKQERCEELDECDVDEDNNNTTNT